MHPNSRDSKLNAPSVVGYEVLVALNFQGGDLLSAEVACFFVTGNLSFLKL